MIGLTFSPEFVDFLRGLAPERHVEYSSAVALHGLDEPAVTICTHEEAARRHARETPFPLLPVAVKDEARTCWYSEEALRMANPGWSLATDEEALRMANPGWEFLLCDVGGSR